MTKFLSLIISISITHLVFRLMQYFGIGDYVNGWLSCTIFSITIMPFVNGVKNDKRIKDKEVQERFTHKDIKRDR